MPEIEAGMYLIDILFKIGPIRGEMPLVEADLEPWERRRGIALTPWQADLVLDMSKAYMSEMYPSKSLVAPCPWGVADNLWMHVTSKKAEKDDAARKLAEEKRIQRETHGSHQRHRNSPTG